jgi:hypothetical protein
MAVFGGVICYTAWRGRPGGRTAPLGAIATAFALLLPCSGWESLLAGPVDALIRKGLLKPETRNNSTALREALYAVLDGTLGATP